MNIKVSATGNHSFKLSRETMTSGKLKTIIPVNSMGGRSHDTLTQMVLEGQIRSSAETAVADETVKLANWAIENQDALAYQDVTLTSDMSGQVVNNTQFSDAFVVNYTESYDVRSGVGSFTAVLRQNKDDLLKVQSDGGYGAE